VESVKFAETLIEELSIILDTPVAVDTDLLADAGLDSFGTMQIIVFLEEEYGIQVLDDKFNVNDFASVAIIARWALPMINAMESIE
jgi:acyl carrier protein